MTILWSATATTAVLAAPCALLEAQTGLAEAEAAEMRMLEELEGLEGELMNRPAMTLAGLRAKASAWDNDDPDFAAAIVRELRELANA